MNHSSFLTDSELKQIGFKVYGKNVRISRFSSIYSPEKIELGSNIRIDDFTILSGGAGIVIGNYVHIGSYSALYGGAGIKMKDFSNISTRAALFSECDSISGKSLLSAVVPREWKNQYKSGPIVLKKHAGVGTNSTIMPKVTLREGAILCSHSLAIRTCSAWMISGGVPAKSLRKRFKDIQQLEQDFLKAQGS